MTNDEWRNRVDGRLSDIETRMGHIETTNEVGKAHRSNVERRLGNIEGDLKWLVRLVIGALVLAAIGFAMKGGFAVV